MTSTAVVKQSIFDQLQFDVDSIVRFVLRVNADQRLLTTYSPSELLKRWKNGFGECRSWCEAACRYTQNNRKKCANLQCVTTIDRRNRKLPIIFCQGQKLLAIHCVPDHTHVLIGLKPNMALSNLVGDIKTGSTNHINENRWVMGRFSWQEGFGAFSYSHSRYLRSTCSRADDQQA